ncbi:MAG: MptD family putative ECF transporter S component [Spirochaetales bacterium]
MNDYKMQTRDYITGGIFSLIYTVVTFVVGAITQSNPVTFLFMPMAVAIFSGPVYMLYVAKIPKRGSIILLGLIAGILSFIGGMFWMMGLFFVVFGIIADCICAIGKHKSFKLNLLSYAFFAISPGGGHLAMFFLQSQFDEFMQQKGDISMFEESINLVAQNWWVAALITLGSMACGVVGGLIGKKMMKKHFERAGIV